MLALAVTAFLLLLLDAGEPSPLETTHTAAGVAVTEQVPDDAPEATPEEVAQAALDEARATATGLWVGFLRNLPRYLVAFAILFLAWVVTRIAHAPLRRVLRTWERAEAVVALGGVVVWLFALGIAVSVLVGDVRALVGSLGLVGLALSWALQSPIEAFTGWLMNGIRGYYRVGDRIAVGELLGDVYQIDVFTTTIWEIGGLGRPGVPVGAEQPTGRLITFPNNEVLTGSIVNFTRDFPYVWDEISVAVGSRSDLPYAKRMLADVASRVVGDQMGGPAETYERILRSMGLERTVSRVPEVFVSPDESWTNLAIRYLVHARERRIWKSRLTEAVSAALDAEDGRIVTAYPRRQIMLLGPDERPREPRTPSSDEEGPAPDRDR